MAVLAGHTLIRSLAQRRRVGRRQHTRLRRQDAHAPQPLRDDVAQGPPLVRQDHGAYRAVDRSTALKQPCCCLLAARCSLLADPLLTHLLLLAAHPLTRRIALSSAQRDVLFGRLSAIEQIRLHMRGCWGRVPCPNPSAHVGYASAVAAAFAAGNSRAAPATADGNDPTIVCADEGWNLGEGFAQEQTGSPLPEPSKGRRDSDAKARRGSTASEAPPTEAPRRSMDAALALAPASAPRVPPSEPLPSRFCIFCATQTPPSIGRHAYVNCYHRALANEPQYAPAALGALEKELHHLSSSHLFPCHPISSHPIPSYAISSQVPSRRSCTSARRARPRCSRALSSRSSVGRRARPCLIRRCSPSRGSARWCSTTRCASTARKSVCQRRTLRARCASPARCATRATRSACASSRRPSLTTTRVPPSSSPVAKSSSRVYGPSSKPFSSSLHGVLYWWAAKPCWPTSASLTCSARRSAMLRARPSHTARLPMRRSSHRQVPIHMQRPQPSTYLARRLPSLLTGRAFEPPSCGQPTPAPDANAPRSLVVRVDRCSGPLARRRLTRRWRWRRTRTIACTATQWPTRW
jgi:hypothetical protein